MYKRNSCYYDCVRVYCTVLCFCLSFGALVINAVNEIIATTNTIILSLHSAILIL